jgi:hypothetical protein
LRQLVSFPNDPRLAVAFQPLTVTMSASKEKTAVQNTGPRSSTRKNKGKHSSPSHQHNSGGGGPGRASQVTARSGAEVALDLADASPLANVVGNLVSQQAVMMQTLQTLSAKFGALHVAQVVAPPPVQRSAADAVATIAALSVADQVVQPPAQDLGALLSDAADGDGKVSTLLGSKPEVNNLGFSYPGGASVTGPVFTDYKQERLGPTLLAHVRAQGYATLVRYVEGANVEGRASHEARRMAQVIDASLQEGVPATSLAMEIAMRALTGVVYAAQQGNPALLDQLEWNPPGAALPTELAHKLIKQTNRAAQASKKHSPGANKDKRPGGAQ